MQPITFKEVDLFVFDCVPVVSTFSNLVYLFLKYTAPWLSEHITKSRCWAHIESKDEKRCYIAMVPIVGNLICLLMNNDDWHAKNYELYQQQIKILEGITQQAIDNTQQAIDHTERALDQAVFYRNERDKAVASLLIWQIVDELRSQNFIYKNGVYL